MNALEQKIEGVLFIAGKPLSVKKISEIVNAKPNEVEEALESIQRLYTQEERGVNLMKQNSNYQIATSPQHADIIESFIKSEQTGELTKPSLETLTIVAYRGPVTKSELEQIRGVNCSLILRNLLIKGLVESEFDRSKRATVYSITFDFMEFLGISRVEELPDFERLHSDDRLQELLKQQLEPSVQEKNDDEQQGK